MIFPITFLSRKKRIKSTYLPQPTRNDGSVPSSVCFVIFLRFVEQRFRHVKYGIKYTYACPRPPTKTPKVSQVTQGPPKNALRPPRRAPSPTPPPKRLPKAPSRAPKLNKVNDFVTIVNQNDVWDLCSCCSFIFLCFLRIFFDTQNKGQSPPPHKRPPGGGKDLPRPREEFNGSPPDVPQRSPR